MIGLAQVDAWSGRHPEAIGALVQMMSSLGYAFQHFDRADAQTGSSIFYKRDKLNCIKSEYRCFASGESEFMMHCLFSLKADESFQFVFAETSFSKDLSNPARRLDQCRTIKEGLTTQYRSIPVFLAGDFNEDPNS